MATAAGLHASLYSKIIPFEAWRMLPLPDLNLGVRKAVPPMLGQLKALV